MAVYFSKQNSTFEAEFKSNLKISGGGGSSPPLPLPLLRACSRRKLSGEISTLGKLLLVIPASNAVGERSFSALRRGKTYLNSTTGDSRLHHHMILHVHNDGADAPTLLVVAHDFEGKKENRKQLLGKFFANDIPKKFSIDQ